MLCTPLLHAMQTPITHHLHPNHVLCTPWCTAHPCYGPYASCYMPCTPVACYSHSYYTLLTLITYYVHLHALCTPLLCTTCTLLHAMHTPITHYMHPHYVLCAPSLCTSHTHYKLCAPCYMLYTHPYYELHTLGAPSLHTPSLYSTCLLCAVCTLVEHLCTPVMHYALNVIQHLCVI